MSNLLPPQFSDAIEGLDLDKLKVLVRKNIWLIIIFFLTTNLAAYLTLRWTKDIYESRSELKLEIKQDATALGIKEIVEDQSRNIIAGEIEQMKSKLFFSRVIDSLDLWVSYYSIGNVLEFEMYRRSPFKVDHSFTDSRYMDQQIFFDFIEGGKYQIKIGEEGDVKEALLGESISIPGGTIRIQLSPLSKPDFSNHFFFVINSREKLFDFLGRNLKIDPINFDANTIRVSFQDYNALKVYTVVNKFDSVYLQYSDEQKNMANIQKIEWLNNELSQMELKMENFENYFEDFILKNKSSSADADLRKTIFIMNQIDSQRFELNKKLNEINALMDDLAAGSLTNSMMPKSYLPSYINSRIEEFQRLTLDQNRVTLSYKDNTYAYQQKEQEVKNLKEALFSQLTEIKRNWMSSMVELNQRKVRMEKDFVSMPDKSTQYSKNQRFYKLYEEFYLTMMQAKAEFEIANAGSTPDFKILSSATLPSQPVAPNRYIILGIGLVAGLVFNFFFIGIIYLANNKIIGLHEIERSTHAPVLGVIPEMRNNSATPFYIVENPRSIVSEAVRTLRTNLDFFTANVSMKIIVISSTVSGEGKSFLARNLGGILAMSKKRVILLDLDMRKAKDTSNGQVGNSLKGISTILINRNTLDESITKTSIEGLDFIPSGPHPPNPSELLLNGEFETLLKQLRERYDYIVIDTPPVGLVTDGIMAMKRADLSIYVVRANYSRKDFLKNLERVISINKLSNVAVVLNALPSTGKTYGYGYYQEDMVKKSWVKQIFRT